MNKRIAWIAALAVAAFAPAAGAQTITAVYTEYSATGVPIKLNVTGTAFCTASTCATKPPVVRLAGLTMVISGASPTGIGVPLTGQPDGDYMLTVTPSGKSAINYAFTLKSNTGGATGPQGPAGPQGPIGPAGPPGPKGDTGLQGLQGLPGLQGVKGDTGATGTPGATGAKGDKGDKGDTGLAGDGFAFKGVWSDSVAYVTRDVVTTNGSTYVAVAPNTGLNPVVDVANSGGNWALLAARGADGAAGKDGAPGPQGPAGSDGAQGIQGLPGPAGAAGADGAQGLMGLQGPKGDKGDTGNQGVPGQSGAAAIRGQWSAGENYVPGEWVYTTATAAGTPYRCYFLAHAASSGSNPLENADPRNSSSPWYTFDMDCRARTTDVTVLPRATPWRQALNASLVVSSGDYAAVNPVVVELKSLGIQVGGKVSVACVSGSVNIGPSTYPATGCGGYFGTPITTVPIPTNDNLDAACGGNGRYQSYYVPSNMYPIYIGQVIGVFSDATGVVVGQPFAVSAESRSLSVPVGATQIQFGINDCVLGENTGSGLTIRVGN